MNEAAEKRKTLHKPSVDTHPILYKPFITWCYFRQLHSVVFMTLSCLNHLQGAALASAVITHGAVVPSEWVVIIKTTLSCKCDQRWTHTVKWSIHLKDSKVNLFFFFLLAGQLQLIRITCLLVFCRHSQHDEQPSCCVAPFYGVEWGFFSWGRYGVF